MHRRSLGLPVGEMERIERSDVYVMEWAERFEDSMGHADGVASIIAEAVRNENDFMRVESVRGYDQPDACVGIVAESMYPWDLGAPEQMFGKSVALEREEAEEVIRAYVEEATGKPAHIGYHEIEQYG